MCVVRVREFDGYGFFLLLGAIVEVWPPAKLHIQAHTSLASVLDSCLLL